MSGFGMLKTGASEIGLGFKNMGGGLASISAQIVATEARLVLLKGAAVAGGVGFNGMSSQIVATEARLASLKASAANATGGMGSLTSGMANVGKGLLLVGGLAVIAGVAIAGYIGVKAVQAAGDFQQGLNRLVTGAGDVTDNMGKMGQSILGISVGTGVLTGQLLPAMYQIISAGQRGAQAQDTLRVAAMGSVTEQARVVDVAKALTTAMTDYGTGTYNATQFMNGYTRATQLGKVTLETLSNSMGPILPLAKNIGVSFADVAGAMSTMTNAGIPANVAATSLRFLMQSLENPTLKARNAMDAMGLSSVAVGNEMKVSLPGALDMIYKAALKAGPEGSVPFNRAMSDMVGGQRSLQAMLSLTGTHFATFSADSRAITSAMNLSKTAVLGWDVAQGNFNVKMSQAHAAVAALGITVGSALLPMLTRIVGQITPLIVSFTQWAVQSGALQGTITALGAVLSFLVTAVSTLVTWGVRVVQFFQQSQVAGALLEATLIVLAAIIGIAMVAALYSYAAAAYVAAAANIAAFWPVYLVILIIIGVIALVILAVRNWGAIAHWIQGVWAAVIGWLVGAWQSLVGFATSVFNTVRNAIVTAFNATIAWIVNAWHAAIAFIVSIWNTLVAFASSVFNAVKSAIMSVVQSVITWLVNAWNTCVQGIVAAFNWLYAHNYIFQAICDGIRIVVQAVVTWLVTAWQNCVNFISSVWQTLTGLASAAWNGVRNAIMSVVGPVISWLNDQWHAQAATLDSIWATLSGLASSAWNTITSTISSATSSATNFLKNAWNSAAAFLSGVWSTIKQAVVDAWNFIVAQFAAAWGRISGPLSSLGASIGNFFTGLANLAVSWGSSIVQGIADGIRGAIGWVTSAASDVASAITGILGFHRSVLTPPKEGPAKNADQWAPSLVTGFAEMLAAGQGDVSSAAGALVRPLAGQMTTPLSSPQSSLRSGPSRGSSESASDNRPIIIQVGNAQYQAFIRNLGRDMATQIYIQGGGKL